MMRSMPPELVGQLGEHLRHLLVVVDVERGDRDGDAGMPLEQFGLELVEPVGAAGAQRQVTALRGERAGHARAQARARTGDQDLLPSHRRQPYLSSRDSRRSASTLPPVWQVGQYWNDLSANDTSRTVSPHTGHGRPVRACTRSPERFSP